MAMIEVVTMAETTRMEEVVMAVVPAMIGGKILPLPKPGHTLLLRCYQSAQSLVNTSTLIVLC